MRDELPLHPSLTLPTIVNWFYATLDNIFHHHHYHHVHVNVCFSCLHASSLVSVYYPEIISSGQILRIHLTTHASFQFSLIRSSSLTGQLSLPFIVALRTYVECNLPVDPKGKPLAHKGTKSLNLIHPLLTLVITLPTTPILASIL